ncbi:MAG TPA: tetratricopeptide repeat protein, partial [Burkholderiales bacterium]|nr:tetratricopeptide repeat protein [Burkholderiales bacterium]
MSPITENALSHHRAGRLAEAETLYLAALDATPGDAEVLRLLSILRSQQGRADEALALAERAHRADPRSAKANATLASALQAAGRVEEALAGYERALALDPRQPETLFNRGTALDAIGRPAEALASYDAALALRPEFAEALANRGNALQALGRIDAAIASYDRALALRPALLEALNNRGTALQAAGCLAEAIASYENALAIRPDLPNVLNNLGTAYQAMERHTDAVAAYDRALAADPVNVDALANRGHALHLVGRHEEAMASVEKAVSVAPENVAARWSLTIIQIPAICDSEADAQRARGAFVSRLAELDGWLDARRAAGAVDCVGDQHPFLLAYQDLNARDLMRGYGALCARVMADWQARQSLPVPGTGRVRAGPIRVGIASRFFYDQSVWTAIVKGWARNLDASRFKLHFFHLGPAHDRETDYARSRAARFEQGKRGLRQWAEAILAEQLDVLIYPEIGMDPVTMKLASTRLAPVQMTTWGHPLTSGLPTLDYFLSADEMEPASAQDHYTERLVRLPGLGCSYSPLAVE